MRARVQKSESAVGKSTNGTCKDADGFAGWRRNVLQVGDRIVERELVRDVRQIREVERVIEMEWKGLRMQATRGRRGERRGVWGVFVFVDIAKVRHLLIISIKLCSLGTAERTDLSKCRSSAGMSWICDGSTQSVLI